MNHHDHDHDRDHDLGRQLRDAAAHLTLTPGNERATIRAAHRRRTRTRAYTAVAAVTAVAGGTSVAIQQLGSTSPGTLETSDAVQGTADSPGVTARPAAETSAPTDARAAVEVESNYVWNTVTPEAARAVTEVWDGSVPGVVIATAPGRGDWENGGMSERQAYYTSDGISFEPVELDPPVGVRRFVYAEGESIYNVGTAPGVAATEPNPFQVDVSHDRGATWETFDVPIESPADVPMLREYTSVVVAGSPGGPVIAVYGQREIALDELPGGGTEIVQPTADGVLVPAAGCSPDDDVPTTTWVDRGVGQAVTATTTTVVSGVSDPQVTAAGSVAAGGPPPTGAAQWAPAGTVPGTVPGSVTTTTLWGGCATELVSWAELGVPVETVALVGPIPLTLYRITESGIQPIALPDVADLQFQGIRSADEGAVISFYDNVADVSRTFRLDAAGAWKQIEVPSNGDQVTSTATHHFTRLWTEGGGDLGVSNDGRSWSRTDLAPLFEPHSHVSLRVGAANDETFVAVPEVRPDAVAAAGGAELTIDGVTARYASSFSDVTFHDAATGTPIPPELYEWFDGTQPPTTAPSVTSPGATAGDGGFRIHAPDGAVRATFPFAQMQSLRGAVDVAPTYSVLTTTDGVHFGNEPLAALLGVDDAEISAVSKPRTVDRQIIIPVLLHETNPDGSPRQVLLIGTPKT